MNDAIAANIACGAMAGAAHNEIEAAARAVYAQDFISFMPMGYETEVGKNGVKRSSDQRQRIAIAHRLSTVERADRIVVLGKSHIIEAGRQAKPLARGGGRARFPELQFKTEQGTDVRD